MVFPQTLIPLMGMVCLLIFLYNIVSGYKNGFVLKAVELLSILFGVFIAWELSGILGESIVLVKQEAFGYELLDGMLSSLVNRLLLFLVLFIILRIGICLCRPLFKAINWIPLVGFINHLAGALLGALQGVVVIGMILFLFSTPLFANGEEVLIESGLSKTKEIMSSFFYETFASMESLQRLISEQGLKQDDYDYIMDWMDKQGFSESQKLEMMQILKDRGVE